MCCMYTYALAGDEVYCKAVWDRYRCWSDTAPNATVSQPCPWTYPDNITGNNARLYASCYTVCVEFVTVLLSLSLINYSMLTKRVDSESLNYTNVCYSIKITCEYRHIMDPNAASWRWLNLTDSSDSNVSEMLELEKYGDDCCWRGGRLPLKRMHRHAVIMTTTAGLTTATVTINALFSSV